MDEEFDVPETDTDLPGDPMTEMLEQMCQQMQHQSDMLGQAMQQLAHVLQGVAQTNQMVAQAVSQLARPRRRVPIRNEAGDITEVRDALED